MRQFRQDSHVTPLVFWALICVGAAVFFFVHSHKIVSRALRTEEIAAGVGLLVVGPVLLAVYLIRARKVWVGVDPEAGIVVTGERVIRWEEIRLVERRRPRLRKTSGPAKLPDGDLIKAAPRGCDPGCAGCVDVASVGEIFAVVGIVIAALVAIWAIFFVFIPLLIVPLLEVLAPFGDRVTITSRGGKLVLRDLREADEFMRLVAMRKPVRER